MCVLAACTDCSAKFPNTLFALVKVGKCLRIKALTRYQTAAGVKKAVSDYEELAKDPDVDIVYVSNIHPAHKDTSILMLNHGKHVLCEKPLAVSLSPSPV